MTNWWIDESVKFSGDGSRWYPFKHEWEAFEKVIPYNKDMVIILPEGVPGGKE